MSDLRIALLADISEELSGDSISGTAVFTHELVRTLHESAEAAGALSVTLFARRNSSCGVPTVSLDPDSLAIPRNHLEAYALQEAIYTQLFISGMLRDYQLIHCLAPVVSPLLLLSQQGIPVVQTLVNGRGHPSSLLPSRLLGTRIRQVSVGPYSVSSESYAIPPSADLQRFQPHANPAGDFVLWSGMPGDAAEEEARHIAQALALPLKTFASGDPAELVRHARVLLHLPAHEYVEPSDASAWPLRALACGTPVAGWLTESLQPFFTRPELAFFTGRGEMQKLVDGINSLPSRENAAAIRREYVLACFGRRAAAARYRELYNSFLKNE
jgi:hypothetical protein